jgi:putative transcriptional regulator
VWHSGRVLKELAPGLLAAAPSLRCPFFHHTLVLLIDHGADGSFGFVLNKEAPLDFRGVVEELGLEVGEDRVFDVPVLRGGPVSPETGWIVFDPDGAPKLPKDVLRFANGLALTASVDMLHAMADGLAPERAILTLGYAGWSPGQLEGELREGSWIPVDLDPALIFERPIEDRWRIALESLGIDPGRVTSRIVPQA